MVQVIRSYFTTSEDERKFLQRNDLFPIKNVGLFFSCTTKNKRPYETTHNYRQGLLTVFVQDITLILWNSRDR